MTFVTMAVLAAGSASAQDPRVEISGLAGWTFSDGVTGEGTTVPGVGTFNGIEPKDSFSWGLTVGFFVSPTLEVGFLFDRQESQFQVTGTSTINIGDVGVANYHGILAHNFGESDAQVRPFVFGGLGATHYGTVSYTGVRARAARSAARRSSRAPGAPASRSSPARVSASGFRPAGRRPTSSRRRRAGGATPSGAATWCPTRSTRTSSS